jgi:hypothetical protein
VESIGTTINFRSAAITNREIAASALLIASRLALTDALEHGKRAWAPRPRGGKRPLAGYEGGSDERRPETDYREAQRQGERNGIVVLGMTVALVSEFAFSRSADSSPGDRSGRQLGFWRSEWFLGVRNVGT